MIPRALAAEWVKFATVRAPRLLLLLTAMAGIVISTLIGMLTRSPELSDGGGMLALALSPWLGGGQLPGAAAVISAIVGVLTVTTEIRFSTLRVTFLAMPRRGVALAAKTTVTALVCAVAMTVGAGLSIAGYSAVGGRIDLHRNLEVWPALPLSAALFATLGVAIGAVVRNAAGAITLLLGYLFVVENVVLTVPRLRPAGPFLPLANNQHLLGSGSIPMHWGAVGSAVYLVLVCGAVWVVAAVWSARRDA